jgi:hypothetical protein
MQRDFSFCGICDRLVRPGDGARMREKDESERDNRVKKAIGKILALCVLLGASPAFSQVKMTHDQILFYTSEWKCDRFPDGRPKLPDSLLRRALDMTIEDLWE